MDQTHVNIEEIMLQYYKEEISNIILDKALHLKEEERRKLGDRLVALTKEKQVTYFVLHIREETYALPYETYKSAFETLNLFLHRCPLHSGDSSIWVEVKKTNDLRFNEEDRICHNYIMAHSKRIEQLVTTDVCIHEWLWDEERRYQMVNWVTTEEQMYPEDEEYKEKIEHFVEMNTYPSISFTFDETMDVYDLFDIYIKWLSMEKDERKLGSMLSGAFKMISILGTTDGFFVIHTDSGKETKQERPNSEGKNIRSRMIQQAPSVNGWFSYTDSKFEYYTEILIVIPYRENSNEINRFQDRRRKESLKYFDAASTHRHSSYEYMDCRCENRECENRECENREINFRHKGYTSNHTYESLLQLCKGKYSRFLERFPKLDGTCLNAFLDHMIFIC